MIGENVKKLREERGLTQEDLADMLKITRSAVTMIEANRRKVSSDEVVALCQIFGVSADALLDNEVKEDPSDIFVRTFNQLSSEDQREVIDMIHFKISFYKEKEE